MTLKHQDFINPQHDARDAKRRIAIECRAAGISGVAPLPRYAYTVNGKASRTVNFAAAGLCPSLQATVDTERAGTADVSKCARYASHYKGADFGASMERARSASEHAALSQAWFKAQFPWLPTDAAGSLRPGRFAKDGTRYWDWGGTRFYSCDLYAAYAANEGAEQVEQRMAHERELQALVASQMADKAHERKHSRKAYMI